MAWLTCLLFFTHFLSSAFTSPIHPSHRVNETSVSGDSSHIRFTRDEGWKWELDDLANEFKGIYWDQAFKGCTPAELNKVIFSTRAAQWSLDLVANNARYPYSAAWNRYFGDYPIWYKSAAHFLSVAAQIQRECKTFDRRRTNLPLPKTTSIK